MTMEETPKMFEEIMEEGTTWTRIFIIDAFHKTLSQRQHIPQSASRYTQSKIRNMDICILSIVTNDLSLKSF